MRVKRLLLIVTFAAVFTLGFLLSWDSIANQAGYTEIAWYISHIDFTKHILQSAFAPLNYLFVVGLERLAGISIGNAWKITDLTFGGLLSMFLVNQYWSTRKPKTLLEHLLPLLTICGTFGLIYSLTSMTGEGTSIFFAVVSVYYWQKRKFLIAVPFLYLSFLSKYTLYLIAPGVFLWTLIHFRELLRKQKFLLILALALLLTGIFSYNFVKHFRDITGQSTYSGNFSLTVFLSQKLPVNMPLFLLALVLGAPLATSFVILQPGITNIYWLSGISSLFVLNTRYFDWYYPVEIIPFFLLYLFTHPQNQRFLKFETALLQILLATLIALHLPLEVAKRPLFPKHVTKFESFALEEIIKSEYKGGKIGFYQNVRTDFPYPAYDIAYLDPAWDFVIEDTEFVVLPWGPVPERLTNFKHCQFMFWKFVEPYQIYKVSCAKPAKI